jgi:hypothetical protein
LTGSGTDVERRDPVQRREDAVAGLDAEPGESIAEPGALAGEIGVAEDRRLAALRQPAERLVAAPPLGHMAVDRLIGDVEAAPIR